MSICKSSPCELDNPKLHGSDDNGIGNSGNDMWSLIRPELRSVSDAFVSLLSANGRSANGDRCQWEKKQPSYSRNSSVIGFQLCTEGLGCESCDGLTDSDDSSSSFSCSSPPIDKGGDVLAEEEEDDNDDDDIEGGGDPPISQEGNFAAEEDGDMEDGGDPPISQESNFSAEEDDNYIENGGEKARKKEINGTKNASPTFRKFPPPLPSISRSNASSVFMRSYKKDGRFVLQAVKVPSSKYLQAFREGGRLKMQLIRTEEELPEVRAPEGNAGTHSDEQNDDPVDDDDDDDVGSEPESCSDCDDLAVGKPGAGFAPANHKAEFLSREYFVETFEYFARKNYLAFVNAGILFNSECENADDGGVSSKRRSSGGANAVGGGDRLTEMNTAHVSVKSRQKPRAGSGCLNAYYGWRTTSQRTSGFCHGTQTLQKSPSPSAWVLHAGSDNERRSHSLPKFRSKELVYGRCQEAKASSVWAHCVATST